MLPSEKGRGLGVISQSGWRYIGDMGGCVRSGKPEYANVGYGEVEVGGYLCYM